MATIACLMPASVYSRVARKRKLSTLSLRSAVENGSFWTSSHVLLSLNCRVQDANDELVFFPLQLLSCFLPSVNIFILSTTVSSGTVVSVHTQRFLDEILCALCFPTINNASHRRSVEENSLCLFGH